jgi:hypothetical protein
MRRVVLLSTAVVAVLALVVAVAFAADNTYSVTGSSSPHKAGSKSKPVPVSVSFNYTVGTTDPSTQPSAINKYKIDFYGVRSVNGDKFQKCSPSSIEQTGSDANCPTAAVMGQGSIDAVVYPSNDPASSTLIPCKQKFKFYNSGKGKAVLYLYPDPAADPNSNCGGLKTVPPIPINYVKGSGGGTALSFNVAPQVLHAAPGLTTAVRSVKSTINRKTVKKGGKIYGYYESVKCNGKNRPITVTFGTEAGQTSTAKATPAC